MMRIKLSELRKLVAEEVDRLVRNSAGFGGIAGIAGRGRGSAELPPLGLGDEKEQEKERYGKEQEEAQFTPRVEKYRAERKRRQD